MMDEPQIDLEQARLFLETLAPDNNLTFQLIPERADIKGVAQAKVIHCGFDDLSDTLVENNQRGYGIFVMVNEGDGQGRKTKNVVKVRAYVVDLDGAPVEPLTDSAYPPHLLVESSPGKWHGYWLAANCPLEQYKARQQSLLSRFGGDPAVCDLPRVMRLPGFLHQKGDPVITRLVWPKVPTKEGVDHE